MLLSSLIGQTGGGMSDILLWLLPLFLCMILMSQRRESSPQKDMLMETWHTTNDIEKAYGLIKEKFEEWRRAEKESQTSDSIISRFRGFLSGTRGDKRFIVREEIPPRLYRASDTTGPLIFELTEVESGGTVVTAMYNYSIKARIARFKANLPLKIPAVSGGIRCPSCGHPAFKEFVMCPYCGGEMIKAE